MHICYTTMDSIRSVTNDPRPIAEYRNRAAEILRWKETEILQANGIHRNTSDAVSLALRVIDWELKDGDDNELHTEVSVKDLEKSSTSQVRIIFAPEDSPAPERVEAFVELFETCGVPGDFISESVHGVSQSFGTRTDDKGTQYTWCHILSKNLPAEVRDGRLQIVHQLGAKSETKRTHTDLEQDASTYLPAEAEDQDQASFSWIKAGFVLKIEHAHGKPMVTLFCFNAPQSMWDTLQNLKKKVSCEDVAKDPYILLNIGLDEMFRVLDQNAWLVSKIFGEIETKTLGIAAMPGKAWEAVNFTALHNLAKHQIYLRENCDAALVTLENLQAHHARVIGRSPDPWQLSTQQVIEYRKTMFQSTQRRLGSLDQRMANIMQLSFHLVTLADSKLMQVQNKSMKTIAVLTLVFMPLGTVAAIFGTQLIWLQEEEPNHMQVSQDFWLLWLIAVPLTAVVYIIWRVWYLEAKAQLKNDPPSQLEGERGYMGWKALNRRMKAKKRPPKDVELIMYPKGT